MSRPAPLFANDRNAAKMMDMPPSEFLRLVAMGALPRPVEIAGHQRWRVADLAAINDGSAMDEDFET